jgi:hypothetical protein
MLARFPLPGAMAGAMLHGEASRLCHAVGDTVEQTHVCVATVHRYHHQIIRRRQK